MIKAAALYIVIIISLMIAVISVSLLSVAFYYRLEHQKNERRDRLMTNLESGTAILLSSSFPKADTMITKSLYGSEQDSLILERFHWGLYGVDIVKAFEQKDTIRRSFLSGCTYNDLSAIYLADEDRPLSLSGSTQITGDGELPKSGLKQSYVEGKPYAGKELIHGNIHSSTRDLPVLDEQIIAELINSFNDRHGLDFKISDSLQNSFYSPVKVYRLKKTQQQLSGIKINGRVIIVSDTILTLSQDLFLKNAQLYAPAIVVADGFKGSCQLFAQDSIVIGRNCEFRYPSVAGIFKSEKSKIQSKITLGTGSKFRGILFSYEKGRSDLQTLISLEKGTLVEGQVYATGYIKMEAPVSVFGKVSAKRFLMQKSATIYENYLIDVILNRSSLSKYYLSSPIFKKDIYKNQILEWLN